MIRLSLAGMFLLLAFAHPALGQVEPAATAGKVAAVEAINAQLRLSHPVVLAGQAATIHAMLALDGAAEENPAAVVRPPLNLALVIDRSGSMAEPTDNSSSRTKMSYAIAAGQRFVESLGDQDTITVVEYDNYVTLMAPPSKATAAQRAGLRSRINELSPRGSTNLAGGLFRGSEEIAGHVRPGTVSRVVLMSDGLANQGMTDPEQISRGVRAMLGRGVRASAVGLGLDYNEDLMQLVAESGGGRYYYVESPTQLAGILAEELKLAAAAVATDIQVAFAANLPVRKVEILGYENRVAGAVTDVTQHDLSAKEKRSVLLQLELPALQIGEHDLGEVTLAYRDLRTKLPCRVVLPVRVRISAEPSEVTRHQDNAVIAEATLVEAARSYAEAVAQYERGDKQGAMANIGNLANQLGQANAGLKDVRLRKKIEGLGLERQRMEQADQSAQQRQVYLKSSKMTARGSGKGMSTSGLRGSDILMEGSAGFEVERLEKALMGEQLFAGPVDGQFDPALTAAVRAYQTREGLEVDGVAGPATLSRLGLY